MAQDGVTRLVPEGVVDQLEVVDIHKEYCGLVSGDLPGALHRIQPVAEPTAIAECGDRVVFGEMIGSPAVVAFPSLRDDIGKIEQPKRDRERDGQKQGRPHAGCLERVRDRGLVEIDGGDADDIAACTVDGNKRFGIEPRLAELRGTFDQRDMMFCGLENCGGAVIGSCPGGLERRPILVR